MKSRIFLTALTLAICTLSSVAIGAHVDIKEMEYLKQIARREGAVRVAITVGRAPKFGISTAEKNELSKKYAATASILRAELGDAAFDGGVWTNDGGRIGLYVKEAGLDILAGSGNAISFGRDITDKSRRTALDLDGSLTAVNEQITASGPSLANLFLNTESASYQLLPDGSTAVVPSPELNNEITGIVEKLKALPGVSAPFAAAIAQGRSTSPVLTVRIDKASVLALQNSKLVRAIKPLGFKDTREANWPSEVLAANMKSDSVEVILTLRGGDFYSPETGNMSARAAANQARANRSAVAEILGSAGLPVPAPSATSPDELGTFIFIAPAGGLAKLYEQKDYRVLDIQMNRPSGTRSLSNSVPLINMPAAWTAGFGGAGQNIVVIDDGIRKSHGMLLMGTGTKVVQEECYGSDSAPFRSICPAKDMFGDSAPGTIGAGEPNPDLIECQLIGSDKCGHGTHVAGIAAGRYAFNVNGGILQGVAPDANLISINIFSYDRRGNRALYFITDLQKALNSVKAKATLLTPNPYVVNMSLTTTATFTSDCDGSVSIPIRNIIRDLRSRGVPVVAATGNYGIFNGVSHPACGEYVIKVGAVKNDGGGVAYTSYTNLAPQLNYTYPFFLAPGGENGVGSTIVSAARTSDTDVMGLAGTSMASPHVAGLAAVYKAANPANSVDDFIQWVQSTGSVPVSVPLPGAAETFRRIAYP